MKVFEDFNKLSQNFNNKDVKIIYDFDKVSNLIRYFNSEYEDYPNKQGWGIFDSDTEIPNVKYWSNKMWMGKRVGGYYQVQKLDSPGTGEALIGDIQTDSQAWELARKTGLMVDEYGVIYGWKGKSILEKNIYNMKHIKTFENYVDSKPINFEEVFGISEKDLGFIFADLTDRFPFIQHEVTSKDYNKFKIEIFNDDASDELKKEFDVFKNKILPDMKKWLDDNNLRIVNSHFDDERNRIITTISKIKV